MADRGRGRGRAAGGNRGQGGGGRGGGEGAGAGRGGRGRGAASAGPEIYRPSHGGATQPNPNSAVEALESKLAVSGGKKPLLDVSKLSLDQDVPYRPGYGTRGAPTLLWTNYFEILPRPDVSLFRYSVAIEPEVQNRRLKARIIQLFIAESPIRTLAPGIASDYQATIITTKKLTDAQTDVSVKYRDEAEQVAPPKAKNYRVRLDQTGSFAVADLVDYLTSSNASAAFADKAQITQSLNIVINNFSKVKDPRTSLSTRNNVHFSVTGSSAEGFDLSAGLQAWRGYFTSVRTAAARLLVNVQIKHAALYKSVRLDELMAEFRQQNGQDPSKMSKFVRGVRVDRLHLKPANGTGRPRPKTINRLANPRDGSRLPKPPKVPTVGATAKQVQFFLGDNAPSPMKSNTYVTVFDYFNKVHKIPANAALPVVNVGTEENPSYLPPEVCFVIPAQPAIAKLSPDQTARMIRFAVRRPFENARSINEAGLANVGLTSQNNVMDAFGLRLQPQMLAVKARILPAPNMSYAGNGVAQPRFGAWNMGSLSFSKGGALDKWSVLWLKSPLHRDPWDNNPDSMVATLKDFATTLIAYGVRCAKPGLPGKNVDVDQGNDELAIKNGFKNIIGLGRNETVLLVLMPRRDDGLYSIIKRCGDVYFGIHTICVVADKFAKPNNVQYFANVALKCNLKLGGVNQTLDSNKLGFVAQGKTMLVGIDVTHPSPGSKESAPSVAAMVASVNKDLGQFPAVLKVQKSRQEMVDELCEMLKSRLSLWQKHNANRLPENILVYRDGVSEGQYSIVLDKELPFLRQACQEVYPPKSKQPAISIVIVGKRHSTRFYPTSTDRDKIDERSSNPKNGTIVDRGITEPRNWDFYLQAHTALQGTARPAHYFVIHDEIFTRLTIPTGFAHASDVLEDLTHNLCYMFGRATKAVSYCPPAYYADLVCERGRCYLSDLFSPSASQAESSAGGHAEADENQHVHVHDAIKDSMFYI